MDNIVNDLESLASVGIDDRSDLFFSHDNIANTEGRGGVLESILQF